MKVWNVIETTSYEYKGDIKHTSYVMTCVSEDVALKVRLDMEREYIENLYEDNDGCERRMENDIEVAQNNHEFVYANCETTTWEIKESEMCYE